MPPKIINRSFVASYADACSFLGAGAVPVGLSCVQREGAETTAS